MYFINPFCMEQPIPSALLNDSQKCELDLECNHSQGQKFKKKKSGGVAWGLYITWIALLKTSV